MQPNSAVITKADIVLIVTILRAAARGQMDDFLRGEAYRIVGILESQIR